MSKNLELPLAYEDARRLRVIASQITDDIVPVGEPHAAFLRVVASRIDDSLNELRTIFE